MRGDIKINIILIFFEIISPVDYDLPFLNGLTGLAKKWKEVGDHLGVPVDQLEVIQQNNCGGVDMTRDCLRDMFIWWLRNVNEACTVEMLTRAVHAVGEHGIEKRINNTFGKLKSVIASGIYI